MKRKALVVLFGAILVFQVVFALGNPSIELIASNKTAGEAQAIDFSAVIGGVEESELQFEWDFGDGFKALTNGSTTSHAYYLEGVEKEREFTVKVKVEREKTPLGEESLRVVIKRSEFKPTLLQPVPLPGYAMEKGSIHSLSLVLLDAFGQELPLERIIDLNASVNNQGIDLNWDKRGFLVGSIRSSNSFHSIEKLEIEAEIQGAPKKKFSLPLFFKPLKISVSNPFKEDYYFDSLIGRIALSLSLPDNSIPEKGKFTAMLLSGERVVATKELFFEGMQWIAELGHRVSVKDFEEGLELVVFGQDEFGNRLKKTSFRVPLKESNPLFDVVLVKPFSGESGVLGFGQLVEFVARVNSTKTDMLQDIRVLLQSSDSRIKKELEWDGENFRALVRMPEQGNSELVLLLLGSAKLEGQGLHSIKKTRISLSREIGIEFLYPPEGRTVEEGEVELLKVRLFYPNGKSLTEENVKALLFVDGKKYEITLLLDREKPVYYSELPEKLAGEHELGIELLAPFEGATEISTSIVRPVNWFFVLGLALIVLLIGFFCFALFSRAKSKREEKIVLKARISEIDRQLKKARLDYFQRKLTESEYRERVLKLQQEKEIIMKRIKSKKKN